MWFGLARHPKTLSAALRSSSADLLRRFPLSRSLYPYAQTSHKHGNWRLIRGLSTNDGRSRRTPPAHSPGFGRLGTLSLSASEYSPRQITSRSTRRRSNRRRERRFMRLRSSTAVERQSSRSRRVRLQPVLSLFARPNLGEAARFAR